MSLCYSVGYKWVTVINGIKFEINDIISLLRKRFWVENGDGLSAKDILYCIEYWYYYY